MLLKLLKLNLLSSSFVRDMLVCNSFEVSFVFQQIFPILHTVISGCTKSLISTSKILHTHSFRRHGLLGSIIIDLSAFDLLHEPEQSRNRRSDEDQHPEST